MTRSYESKFQENYSERRLDSLARLLGCSSVCAAVVLIDGTLYVAANEIKKRAKNRPSQTKQAKDCRAILQYFKEHKNKKKDGVERLEMFKYICKERIKIASNPMLGEKISNIGDAPLDWLIEKAFQSKNSKFKFEKVDIEPFQKIYEKCRRIRKDFRKFENLINKRSKSIEERKKQWTFDIKEYSPEPSDDKFIDPELNTISWEEEEKQILSALDKDPVFEPTPGEGHFHAESILVNKILDHVLDLKKNNALKNYTPSKPLKFYIGISKLCCLNCRCLIDAANEHFKKEKLSVLIQTRGKHDISFNWEPPVEFSSGYTAGVIEGMQGQSIEDKFSTKKEQGIKNVEKIINDNKRHPQTYNKKDKTDHELIGYEAGKKFLNCLQHTPPEGVRLEAEHSDSETESVNEGQEMQGAEEEFETLSTMEAF